MICMKRISIVMVLVCAVTQAFSQITEDQMSRIADVDFYEVQFSPRKPKLLKPSKHAIINYNPITLAFSGSLFIYQKLISPQLQSKCPYEISCSAFSFKSIEEFGLVKGVALSVDRLTRCTQFTVIDMMPSQINERSGMIIDNPSKYRVKNHHDHSDHVESRH
jgi:uncharacterized protein